MWTQDRGYAAIAAIWLWFVVCCVLGALALIVAIGGLLVLLVGHAFGMDNGQWAGQPPAVRDWYQHAELTPAARRRLGWVSCCAHSDVVHTKFRVGVTGDDVWEWLDGTTWRIVPADIIHWGEHAPDGQATLFVFGSTPTCFYPPESGQ